MFQQFTTKELIQYIRQFKFTRKLKQYHIHHTWKPNYSNFSGNNHQAIQQGMKDYHINSNGWQDIAQHFTLFPDGGWLLGRDLNLNPASITGWNTGAICVEMIGNFDVGYDKMTETQKTAILEMSSFMTKEMGLEMKFHRDSPTAGKTCPGTGINRSEFFREVSEWKEVEEMNWKQKIVQEAFDLGLITDHSWIEKTDEGATIWFVLACMLNIYRKLKG